MKRLYESLLDDEDVLIDKMNNAKKEYISNYYINKLSKVSPKYLGDTKYQNSFVTFDNKNIQLHFRYITLSKFIEITDFIDIYYTDILRVENKTIYNTNFKDKQIELEPFAEDNLHSKLVFAIPGVSVLENIDIKSKNGIRNIQFASDFKAFKNCKFEMADKDNSKDTFKINVGMSKINDWKTFKELTIVNKSKNNKNNPLTLKVGDTPLANDFFKKIKKYNPATQTEADYKEIQKTALNYFYKEIEPNIKHIPGLSGIYMFVHGGWNSDYTKINKKWRGFIKDQITGEWTYIDKYKPDTLWNK